MRAFIYQMHTSYQGHAASAMGKSSAWNEVYEIVRLIPPGTVMTYGQIAKLCGRPLTPRAVGWAMHDCPADVPWHRVVNSKGGCSTDHLPGGEPGRQRGLLEAEGIEFRNNGTVDLSRYGPNADEGRKHGG
jgi:methylated-DNA-protein-cysteine methyltransferase-like protein